MPGRVSPYVAAICLSALSAIAALYAVVGQPVHAELHATAFFGALFVLSLAMRYQQRGNSVAGNIGFVPLLAGAATAPTPILPLMAAFAAAVVDSLERRELIKVAFNAAQLALSVSLAVLVYLACGGTSAARGAPVPLVPFAALCVTLFVVNVLAVSGVIALAEGRRFVSLVRKRFGTAIAYDVLAIPIVYVFAIVYQRFGVEWTVALIVPLLGLRQLYKQNWLLEKTNEELLQLMVAAIEARDPYTSGHSRRVARYAQVIGRSLALSERQLERLRVASLLHDVGKIHELYAPILRKAEALTDGERRLMETHTTKGAELASKVSQLQDVVPAIQHHHERWDGTGYPTGIAGEAIPLVARIVGVADTIDAMTTDRPYRRPMIASTVRTELINCAGSQFDPAIVARITEGEAWSQLERVIAKTQGDAVVPIDDDATPALKLVSRAQSSAQ